MRRRTTRHSLELLSAAHEAPAFAH
ncbi:hypothetical protein A2U01_0086380, partial [Trifolium medium]|nr:hypothetical protein [Trifolium medium]